MLDLVILIFNEKAERCIKKAEVILYDRLVNPLILQYAPADAEFIDVGKKPYAKHIQQDEINLKSLKRLKVPNSHSSQRWRSSNIWSCY